MKAILVIDEMPKNCDECPYCGKLIAEGKKRGKKFIAERERRACLFVKNYIFYGFDVESGRHECCPLKAMPTKKKPLFDPDHCEIEKEIKIAHEIVGYNRCIDEILGETE